MRLYIIFLEKSVLAFFAPLKDAQFFGFLVYNTRLTGPIYRGRSSRELGHLSFSCPMLGAAPSGFPYWLLLHRVNNSHSAAKTNKMQHQPKMPFRARFISSSSAMKTRALQPITPTMIHAMKTCETSTATVVIQVAAKNSAHNAAKYFFSLKSAREPDKAAHPNQPTMPIMTVSGINSNPVRIASPLFIAVATVYGRNRGTPYVFPLTSDINWKGSHEFPDHSIPRCF